MLLVNFFHLKKILLDYKFESTIDKLYIYLLVEMAYFMILTSSFVKYPHLLCIYLAMTFTSN
jgi:hypothetical protein